VFTFAIQILEKKLYDLDVKDERLLKYRYRHRGRRTVGRPNLKGNLQAL
jgi:hypothetical protein